MFEKLFANKFTTLRRMIILMLAIGFLLFLIYQFIVITGHLLFIFLFIPMLYKGYSPFLSAVIVAMLITIVTNYLIGGYSIKTVASILGTVIGVMVAGGVAVGFGYFTHISGYNVSEVEELVFVANNTNLKVGGILFAGILIASLGAVMDVSISVASAINEVYVTNPNLSKKELFSSGMNVGRDIMGANANTLILAYTGGALNTLILIYVYSMKYNQLINMYSIGIEIMQGLSGIVAVVLTVPIVSFIASQLLTNKSIKSALQKEL
ncbi:MAG: YibE/F family protein [Clostridium sp.]|uniref:YibE/F family protein n=1 Tax=Clostridium sp. TaxID=1506 RepID=UPI003D6CABB1